MTEQDYTEVNGRVEFATPEQIRAGLIAKDKLKSYVESLGLDPAKISRRGIVGDEYEEFVLDEDGNRVLEPSDTGSRPVTVTRKWPENADVVKINTLNDIVMESFK